MPSLEKDVFAVEVALLASQAGLSGFSIVDYDDDDQADNDRIVVQCEPRTIAIASKSGDAALNSVKVNVELILATRSTTNLDAYILAIEAANKGTPAAAAVTLATVLFPNGIKVVPTDDGEREGEGTNARRRSKSFLFLCNGN